MVKEGVELKQLGKILEEVQNVFRETLISVIQNSSVEVVDAMWDEIKGRILRLLSDGAEGALDETIEKGFGRLSKKAGGGNK